jgi:hypothetical protein
VPISSSKALSLVAAPRTVRDEEKHSSIATYLLCVVKPIGVSSSRIGRMHASTKGWTLVHTHRSKLDAYSVAVAVTPILNHLTFKSKAHAIVAARDVEKKVESDAFPAQQQIKPKARLDKINYSHTTGAELSSLSRSAAMSAQRRRKRRRNRPLATIK